MKKYRNSIEYMQNLVMMKRDDLFDARELFRDKTLFDLIQRQMNDFKVENYTVMQSELIRVDFNLKCVIDKTTYFNTGNAA